MGYTTEKHFKIFDDKTGCHITIGPDRDGLELVEMRHIDSVGTTHDFPPITADFFRVLAKAASDYAWDPHQTVTT